ncbi:hypothetical protein SDC9_132940 [bioreactor metagenome]|uniref:Uncharacterized protein n=1 Tax=bioreactor metagenome TaxID=1076179 RepID=A0A645D9I6_9ZZZZ
MRLQVRRLADGSMSRQIRPAGIELQPVIGELAADLPDVLWALDIDRQICLSLRQIDEPRNDQKLHFDGWMAIAEMAQMRRQKEAAETFGSPQPHLPGQCMTFAADILSHQRHGAFHALDMLKQPMPCRGEHMARGRTLEQARAKLFFQPMQSTRDGRVIDPQTPRRLLRRLGSHHRQKQSQVVPIDRVRDHVRCPLSWCKFALSICQNTASICNCAGIE